MTRPNGQNGNGNAGLVELEEAEVLKRVPVSPLPPECSPEVATRARQRAGQQIQHNRFVIVAAGAIVIALLIFVAVSMPHRSGPQKARSPAAATNHNSATAISGESEEKSLFPITDSGRPAAKENHQGFVNERDLQRTVIHSGTNAPQPTPTNGTATLGSIPPFGDK